MKQNMKPHISIKNLNNQVTRLVSKCCKGELVAYCADEGTCHYSCKKCGKECDMEVIKK